MPTGVLLDKIVNTGVLRHISNGIGQEHIHSVGNILVRRLERPSASSWRDSFGHLAAIAAVAIIAISLWSRCCSALCHRKHQRARSWFNNYLRSITAPLG
ncbi:hypothetical protein KCP74_24410 [Salmonella enterica subsp. enterica]|nr:hypothetical protein KCP74_24410 [Salmonella enterica subsp. enterica]